LADAVLGSRRSVLDYRGTLPLGRQITFHAAAEGSEGVLTGGKARAVAIPLALPEWRNSLPSPFGRGAGGEGLAEVQEGDISQHAERPAASVPLLGTSSAAPATGVRQCLFQAVAQADGKYEMELRQSAAGCSLFAPLFFDLDRRRFGKPLTWRQLTVGESFAVQPADAAVGYRVSTGGKQWLIYRSLTPSRNRTLLGHNLSSETLVARFSRKGEVESLIEIE
jgi:hypothetical protein